MDFNHYFTNDELETILKAWVEKFPGLVKMDTIGTSHEGKPIWLITVTNFASGSDQEKPAIWLDGNIHATELAGTTTVLYILDNVIAGFGKDASITGLLDQSAIYAVPRINPDGAGAAFAKSPRFVRSGVRSYPWEELDEGLHVQDIDDDARILQMRIPDPNGDWKPWEQDERYLIKREPDDFGGNYYRLLPEGLIENYDGYCVEIARPAAGLDFNRNFPFEWRPESDQRGAGPYPASEPEINAVVDFISRHLNINIALTFHTFSRVLLRPFSTKPDDQMDSADLYVFKLLGEIGTRLTGYRNASTYHDFIYGPKDITTGAFDDWMYDQFGAFVFTVEQWDLPTEAGVQERKFVEWFSKHPLEDDIMILRWADENVGSQGYVAWYPFEHPQLGPVELGGWNTLYTWRNPPPAFMTQEAERHLPFTLALASLLPHLKLRTLNLQKIKETTWTIDLVVENTGYLPTFTSQQARRRKTARPVMAELKLPKGQPEAPCRIVLGKERMEVGHLEGRSNKDEMSSVFGASPTDNRGHVQWVVEAPPGSQVELRVRSERAGQIRHSFILE